MNYTARINKIRNILSQNGIDAIFATSAANLTYLSGFIPLSPTEREAYLFITKKSASILTSPLYAQEVNTSDFSLKLLSGKQSLSVHMQEIIKNESVKSVGFEEDDLKFFEYEGLAKKDIPLIAMRLDGLRVRKDTEEIAYIAKACAIGDLAFTHVLSIITPGITETDIALELELFVRKQRATLSFPSIVAFGKQAAVPHHVTGETTVKKDEFVLLDFGVKVHGYCSDMSRTVFVGSPTNKQKHMYETVRVAQEKAIEYISSGHAEEKSIHAATADKIARDYITSHGFPSFPHSLGHGIGLEVHEEPSLSPYSKDVLENDMVFSVEPGIYLPGQAGIRIEDLLVIETAKPRLLTNAPKELIVI